MSTPLVWVVDDDEDDQFMLAGAFQSLTPPVALKQLYDGEDLLPALETSGCLPKLVLLDLNMGRQNGFETLEQIRSLAKYEHVPIVVLTTSSAESDKIRSYSLGANGFLTKALSNEDFINMLQLLALEWL
ncbi:response regulator [Spirosoma harenae]